jgi:hypothetical protein
MSLRAQFPTDVDNVWMNTDEFATTREFRISDGQQGFIIFTAPVVWDEDEVRQEPIVTIHGVFMGNVDCFIAAKYLPRAPVAGELIYSPANQPWEVIDCVIAESLYELKLAAYRSQPTAYGRN